MRFEKNEYLGWAMKMFAQPLKYMLADSGIPACAPEDIGLKAEMLSFASVERTDAQDKAKNALARRYGMPAEKVLPAHACSGANFFVAAALIGPGDEVIIERPVYEPLLRIAQACGAKVKYLDRRAENDFDLLPEDLEKVITKKTKMVFITNLHNPTGRRISPEHMRRLGETAARHGAYIVADEIYLEFLRLPEKTDAPTKIPAGASLHDNIISTCGFSKVYGLYGPRPGWILGKPEILELAERVIRGALGQIATTSVNILNLALEKEADLRARTIRLMGARMEIFPKWCEKRGEVKFITPAGGSIAFMKLPAGVNSMQFCERLVAEYETLMVPGEFYQTPGYVRVSALQPKEIIDGALSNVGKLLDKMKKA